MEEHIVSDLAAWRQTSSKGKIKSNVVVTGLSGTGKSALVNALFGEEVSKEEDLPKEKVKKGEKHVLNYLGNSITVWDTCGFCEKNDPRTDQAFDALKSIPCLKKRECSALIYTISITKTRFESNSNDIEGMKRLKTLFGMDIWNNAIIVLTLVNDHYSLKTDGLNEAERKEKYLTKYYKEWVDTVRMHLGNEVVPATQAQNIPIIAAGYLQSSETLECESKGKSWVLNIWQHIAQVVPMEEKPFLLDICINKLFSSQFVFCDSYLSLIMLNTKLYKQKACERRKSEKSGKVGLAYSFLHLLLFRLDNCHITKPKQLTPCETSPNDIPYWTSLETSILVTITGAENSGKTSLLNSMLHGKCVVKECPGTTEQTSNIKLRETECIIEETPLALISQSTLEKSALLILCMKLNDTEANMTRVLCAVADKRQNNILIALTYANANVSADTLDDVVKRQTADIKRILTDRTCMNEQEVESLKIVPAGYHTEVIMTNDSNKHWIMNLWLQAIACTKPTYQAAMIVLVNYFIYGRKSLPTKLAHCKTMYIGELVKVLLEIIKTQKLAINWNIES